MTTNLAPAMHGFAVMTQEFSRGSRYKKMPREIGCEIIRRSDGERRQGLSGRLKPPIRFMYCLYSVFFSFRTPYTSFPGTCVFFVLLNRLKPMYFRMTASISSSSTGPSSTSISSFDESFTSAAPFDCNRESRRSCLRSTLDPRGGGVLDLSLVLFRIGERERSRSLSPLAGYPASL